MPTENETPTQGATEEQAERTFTQAELDAIVRERLRREREKHADYAELQKKAAAYDEAQDAAKTELQKAVERAEKAEAELASIRDAQQRADEVARIAAEKGVDADMLSRMSGDVAENAAWLAEHDAARAKYPSLPDRGEVSSSKGDGTADFVHALFGGER